MTKRTELNEIFEKILGSKNVYFQPPESIKMKYPAIVYLRSNMDRKYADNRVYTNYCMYTVTVIDKDPDSEIVQKVAELPLCSFDRNYQSANLNHDVFTLFF